MKKGSLLFITLLTGSISVYAQSGNVGIGTNTPLARLSVTSDGAGGAGADDVALESYNVSPALGLYLFSSHGTKASPTPLTSGDNLGFLSFAGNNAAGASNYFTNVASSRIGATYRGSGLTDLYFTTSDVLRMTIDQTGNVGVNTPAPTTTLDVNGQTRLRNIPAGVSGDAILTTDVNGNVRQLASGSFATANSAWNLAGNTGTSPASSFIGTADAQDLVVRTNNVENMRIASSGNVGINQNNPQRKLDINAATNPIRVSNIATTNTGSNVLTIDASGDVRSVPFNNMLAGPVSLTFVNTNYTGTGNESIIWNGAGAITVTMPQPTTAQVGKSITLVASGGAITLAGEQPTVTNATLLTNIPALKRITIFGIAAGVFGNPNPTWVVIAKDF